MAVLLAGLIHARTCPCISYKFVFGNGLRSKRVSLALAAPCNRKTTVGTREGWELKSTGASRAITLLFGQMLRVIMPRARTVRVLGRSVHIHKMEIAFLA